jgi:hypothetical protein
MSELVADRGCVIFAPIANEEFKPPVTRKCKILSQFNTIWLDREIFRFVLERFYKNYQITRTYVLISFTKQIMFICSESKIRNA